jgi:hypothetical protein
MFWCCGVPCSHGSVAWPPRSPDFTPADLHLRGQMKSILYAQRCNTLDELCNSIEAAGTTMRNMPDVFQWIRNSWPTGLKFQPLLLTVNKMLCDIMLTANKVIRYTFMFTFLYFLLPYLANEAVATVYLHDCFCLPVSAEHSAYIKWA